MSDEDADVEVNWARMVFYILICIIGLVGNTIVIFVILVLKEYRKSVTHVYVLQLAIADALYLLTLPFYMSEAVNGRWIYPQWMCKGRESLYFLNYYASVTFLMVMSLDRYIAVCRASPDKLQRLRNPRSGAIIAILVWIICLCFMCIPAIYARTLGDYHNHNCGYVFPREGETMEDSEEPTIDDMDSEYSGEATSLEVTEKTEPDSALPPSCIYDSAGRTWINFLLMNFVLMYIIPIAVMAVSYGLIVRKLSSTKFRSDSTVSMTQSNGKKRKTSTRSDKDRRRVTIMCASLVSTFVLLWLPFHVAHLAKIVGINVSDEMVNDDNDFMIIRIKRLMMPLFVCKNLQIAGSLIANLNSAVNPYLYTFLGYNFKTRLLLTRSTIKRQKSSVSGSFGARNTNKKKRVVREGSSVNLMTVITKTNCEQSVAKSSSESSKTLLQVNHDSQAIVHQRPQRRNEVVTAAETTV